MLDLARFFMGEVARISCETQQRNPRLRGEDTATMLLRHESGGVSVVECTYEARRSPDPFPETLVEIEGPRGSIVVDTGCRMTLTSDGKTSETDIGAPLLSWTSHPWHVSQEGALGACRHFLDCLQRGVAAETSGADNLRSYALVDAAYRAAAEHGAVVAGSLGGRRRECPVEEPEGAVTTMGRKTGQRRTGAVRPLSRSPSPSNLSKAPFPNSTGWSPRTPRCRSSSSRTACASTC